MSAPSIQGASPPGESLEHIHKQAFSSILHLLLIQRTGYLAAPAFSQMEPYLGSTKEPPSIGPSLPSRAPNKGSSAPEHLH